MKWITTALLLAIAAPALSDTPVTVNISNIVSDQGQLVVTVYDSKRSWLKKPFVRKVCPLAGDGGDVVLELSLPPGDYGFQVFHDLDSNEKMKTNFIGIPKEPTGVSNNAKGRFGPPKFKDAAVTIASEPVTVALTLVEI